MQPSTESVQRLMEIGFLAAGSGQIKEANTIFAGIQSVRPDSELPMIGQAFVLMNTGKFPDAISTLQAALSKNPDSDLAMSFLGATLKLAGMSQAADNALQQVIADGKDPAAIALAEAMAQHQPA